MDKLKKCCRCGFNECGRCTCPPYDKWYACPIESEKPENIKALKEYAEETETVEMSVEEAMLYS